MIPIVVLDFETFYAGDYSLSKISTEQYIRDQRFEVIGVGIQMPDEHYPTWYTDPPHLHNAYWSPPTTTKKIESIDWSTHAVLCHNGYFDAAILAWRYGIHPKLILDTMCMGQPTFGFTSGVSLKNLMQQLTIAQKGDEVLRALGKRRKDFTPHELAEYGKYCCNDAFGTKLVFERLVEMTPRKELAFIDEVIRCYTDPRLELNVPVLKDYYDEVVNTKQAHYIWAGNLLGCGPDEVKDLVMSNDKLATILTELGVAPPQKLSPTTGKIAYAFAKTDDEFLALREHEDERVQTLVECRLGGKSTIAETRALRFLQIASRGSMPAYFKYYAAHTGRLGGGDLINLQNLTRSSKLRDAIEAQHGHVLVAGDLSQIEARILATIAGQLDIVKAFRDFDAGIGPDIYCVTATSFLGRVITKESDPDARRLGKVIRLALGYGMGVPKFIITAKRDGVKLTPNQAEIAHKWFRDTNKFIVQLWQSGNTALRKLEAGEEWHFGYNGCIVVKADGIHLPSGRVLRYPGLQSQPGQYGNGSLEWSYLNRKKRVRIYGAKVIENICQSLAGSVCGDAWLRLRGKMKMVLQIHDELVATVHESQAEEACQLMRDAMNATPEWLPTLPVACEVGYHKSFGKIKKK